MATLIVLQGPDKGKTLRTTDDHVVLGRGSTQVPLTDQTISRRHAELVRAEGNWQLTDLHSANGTYLNGVRLNKPTRLKYGDQIRLGGTLLVYTGDESIQHFSGGAIPTDLVTLDAGSPTFDASIVASVPSNEDSVVLAAPETAYAVKAWKIMRELSEVIGSMMPIDRLLARVVEIVCEEVEVDRAVVFLVGEAAEDVKPAVVRIRGRRGMEAGVEGAIVASRTILRHVIDSREGVLCSNAVTDERFQSGKSVQNLGMRSVICAPLMARERVLGVLHLDCPVTRHTYNEYELRLATLIAYQAGLAVENARLVQTQVERERLAAAGETVAYLSHYIKNILQGMRSGAEIVQRGLDRKDLGVAGQGWGIVERNLDRSYHLMLNMLAFSKERQPQLEAVQVNRVVEEVVGLVQKQADDKKIVLLPDLDEHVPAIQLDYDGIHQVVLNIVTNAIDAVTRGEGVINVRTSYHAERRRVLVSVADNGPGVPPAERERVFEPFHSTKGHGGTGLGLAVARKIVQELGGTLTLVSPADGGAEFRINLPLDRDGRSGAADTIGPAR